MKPIQLTQTAVVTKYQAFDGTTYDTAEGALAHETAYCDALYEKMHGAAYPKEEIRRLPFPGEHMISIYKDFSSDVYEKLIPDASELDWSKIDTPPIAQINYEMDVDHLLLDHSAEELLKLMEPILEKYHLHKIYFYVLSDIPRGIEAAKIRNNWSDALKNTKDVSDINSVLQWSFTDRDISTLAKLHKSGKFRKKIEDMLEGANFHQESGDFSTHDYEQYLTEEPKEE